MDYLPLLLLIFLVNLITWNSGLKKILEIWLIMLLDILPLIFLLVAITLFYVNLMSITIMENANPVVKTVLPVKMEMNVWLVNKKMLKLLLVNNLLPPLLNPLNLFLPLLNPFPSLKNALNIKFFGMEYVKIPSIVLMLYSSTLSPKIVSNVICTVLNQFVLMILSIIIRIIDLLKDVLKFVENVKMKKKNNLLSIL